MGLGIAGLVVVLTMLGISWVRRSESVGDELQTNDWRSEAIVVGMTGMVFGLLPVILVNRHIIFPNYSRYTLVPSVGAAICLVAALHYIHWTKARLAIVSILVLLAGLTQYTNGAAYARYSASLQNFWWQVSWRIPQMGIGTTLIAHYPLGGIEEDYFVWGPANLIYYPGGTNERYVQPGIYAAVLNQDTVLKVLNEQRQEFDNRRSIRTYKNYRNILILTEPSQGSCVQVINGTQLEFSSREESQIVQIGSYSESDQIILNGPTQTPPEMPFGREPGHGWCFYYEKASLARQQGDWSTVLTLAEEAQGRGLTPGDAIEWLPFLQAYAQSGDAARLSDLSTSIMADPFVAQQACVILSGMQGISDQVTNVIQSSYCLDGSR